MTTPAGRAHARSHAATYVRVWLGLVALTAATWGLSTVHAPGGAGVALALGIATAKGALVALFFMHLRDQRGANRLVLGTALVFVALLVGLTLLDVATRFPLANPPEAETSPARIREAVLGEQASMPPAPGPVSGRR